MPHRVGMAIVMNIIMRKVRGLQRCWAGGPEPSRRVQASDDGGDVIALDHSN